MNVYILTSNGESVEAFSTKEKAIQNLRTILDDDDGSGWRDNYYNETFKSFGRPYQWECRSIGPTWILG